MACDDHVVGSGAEAETYAESIIKAAERSIGAPRGAHQLALFSARQILERRIEMILNKERTRVITQQLEVSDSVRCVDRCSRMDVNPRTYDQARAGAITSRWYDGQATAREITGDNKAFDDLIEMALRDPDVELRRLAAIQTHRVGRRRQSRRRCSSFITRAVTRKSKALVIDTFGRISEVELLAKIALVDRVH